MRRPFTLVTRWMHRHTAPLAVGSLAMLAACTVKVPSHIIQQQEMEDLLYDYHMMQAMAGDLGGGNNLTRKQYEQYVFDKHGITEAEFDTSLAWYMRNTRRLEEVYRKLGARLTAQKEALAATMLPNQRAEQVSKAGDSVNVWPDYRLLRMTDSPIHNRLTFSLSADSNYHVRDSFVWQMDALFLTDTLPASRAAISLTLFLDKDTIGRTALIDSTGSYMLTLHCDSDFVLKDIVGNIYYHPTTLDQPCSDLLLSRISLIRIHRTDTLSASSEATDSVTSVKDEAPIDSLKEKAVKPLEKPVEKASEEKAETTPVRQPRRSQMKLNTIDKR